VNITKQLTRNFFSALVSVTLILSAIQPMSVQAAALQPKTNVAGINRSSMMPTLNVGLMVGSLFQRAGNILKANLADAQNTILTRIGPLSLGLSSEMTLIGAPNPADIDRAGGRGAFCGRPIARGW